MNIYELRSQIDAIDTEILEAIKKRFDIVSQIANYKLENNLPIYDSDRIKEVLDKRIALGKKMGLDEMMIYLIFSQLIHTSMQFQSEKHKITQERI